MKQYGRVIVMSAALLAGSTILPETPLINFGEAASPVMLSNSAYQTTANLNMRTGAGINYKIIMTIPKGKQVTAVSRSGNWYKVTYSSAEKGKKVSRTGWVVASYIKITPNTESKAVVTSPKTAQPVKTPNVSSSKENTSVIKYQTTANLNLRSGPSTRYKVIKTIPKGKVVAASETSGEWVKVSYTEIVNQKNTTAAGWVSAGYLKEYYQYSKINGILMTGKEAQLYEAPDRKRNAIFKVSKDNGFQATQKIINSLGETWFKVAYNGRFVHVQSTEVISQSGKSFSQMNFKTNKDTFLFSSYGNIYTKLVKIPKNTIVSSKYSVGNWYSISFSGKSGYVYGGELTSYTPPVPVQQNPVPKEPVDPKPVAPESPIQDPGQPVLSSPSQEPQLEVVETAVSGKTYVTAANLNLRTIAAADAEILAVLPYGTLINPTHTVSNGWFKTVFSGKTGYVSGGYIKEVVTGDPLHREGYQFINLRKSSRVTAVQINQYIDSNLNSGRISVLKGKGQAFIDAGNKYGVNSLYLAAHAIHESAFGTSNISLGKYNLFGFGAFDAAPYIGAVRFASIEQNIDYIAQELVSTYLNPASWKYKGGYLGFSTRTVSDNSRVDSNSAGMNFYYASDVKWGQKIASHMQKIHPYNSAEYNLAANSNLFSYPARPEGKDVFPTGILAAAKQDIKLVNQKGSTVASQTLKKDQLFTILEKHNDYWVKLSVDSREFWTSDIKFDRYKEFITVKNLGRVTASSLNVRPTASTAQSPIAALNLNDYVHLAIDSAGNIVMDSSKSWYNVKLADERTGWVSAQFVYLELK
jgi:mannosyl-glycoprotein endo-beta-N-acetylglucosaminidase